MKDVNKIEEDGHVFRPTSHKGSLDMDYKKSTEQIDLTSIKQKLQLFDRRDKFDSGFGDNYARYSNFVDALVRVIHFREVVIPLNSRDEKQSLVEVMR